MPAETVGSKQEPTNNKPTLINTGDVVDSEKITVGNISDSYTAIGADAQVIVNQIQQTLSSVDELGESILAVESRLAKSIQKKITRYTNVTVANHVDARSNPYKALLDYKKEPK